jgi:hypothetical protein
MSTMQFSARLAVQSPALTAPQRPVLLLRVLRTVVASMAETNRRRAEREIARVGRSYGIDFNRI